MGFDMPLINRIRSQRWEGIPNACDWALRAAKKESKIHPGHFYFPGFSIR